MSFIAIDDYDMIWIFPHGELPITQSSNGVGVCFAYPELKDVTSFTAGLTPTPTQGNCIVTIGPNVPNSCTFTNAVFTWHGPNGQTITAQHNQQLQVDASLSANVGIWTLTMSALNEISTYNPCSQHLSATVRVSQCLPTCAPIITPSGPIDYYLFADATPKGRILTSSMSTGNQWYYNGSPISGATAQNYIVGSGYSSIASGNYYVINNGCISNSVNINFKMYGYGNFGEDSYNWLGAKTHPVQSSNYYCFNTNNNFVKQFDMGIGTIYSWNIFTLPLGSSPNISITPGSGSPVSSQAQLNIGNPSSSYSYLQGIANLNGSEKIIDYNIRLSPSILPNQIVCSGAPHLIKNDPLSNQGYGTTPGTSGFDWEYYDFGANALIFSGPGAGASSVLIPGRGLAQPIIVKYYGPSYVQKHFYYNYGGCFDEKYNVIMNPVLCRSSTKNEQIVSNFSTTIYPNPASSYFEVASVELIVSVEILNLTNRQLKKFNGNNLRLVRINSQYFEPGIYNCKVTTIKGVENHKIVITQ